MTIQAKALILADSICNGVRLLTFQLQYQRFIHAEFMTHRVFSRNAGSSRAKPVQKVLEQVRTNPAMPCHWGLNQPGMQADHENEAIVWYPEYMRKPLQVFLGIPDEELDDVELGLLPEDAWKFSAWLATVSAQAFDEAKYHKQVVNRLLEPYQYIDVVMSTTDLRNWNGLRDHKLAQPEIQVLARVMKEAVKNSTPRQLKKGEWHLPYISDEERKVISSPMVLAEISAARTARVSITPFGENVVSIKKDLALAEQLASANPMHASPFEHPAQAMGDSKKYGNFVGFKQLRQYKEEAA